MNTWYLVRHGETEWNATARMQGQRDSELTPRGREQARGTADLLARLGVDRIFASPLGRVRQTLEIIHERHERLLLPVQFDDRLKEWSAGEWGGELYADVRERWPDEWAAWQADRLHYAPPGGETFLDLIVRSRAFLTDVASTLAPGERVALVAHGFLNRALATVLLDQPPAEMLDISQDNDTLIRIVVDESSVADYFESGEGPVSGLPLTAPRPSLA
jgi:broad specificity phosphatase PhoE